MSTDQQQAPLQAGRLAGAKASSSSSSARANPSAKRKADAEAARGDAADLLIPVYLRLRPVSEGATSVIPSTDRAKVETYTFSKIYGPTTSQSDLFDEIMKPAVDSMFESGESASLLLAYGASSSGKTFTVTGTNEEPGLLLRTVEDVLKRVGTRHVKKLFKPELWNNVSTVLGGLAKRRVPQHLQQSETVAAVEETSEYSISLSFAECYLDQVYDLQSPSAGDSKKPIKLFQHGSTDTSAKRSSATLKMDGEGRRCIAQQHETRVRTLEEARVALHNALANRTVLGTKMNDQSSRSHLLSVVKLLRIPPGADPSEITVSRIAIADLAGAERLAQSGVEGVAHQETKKINSTLHTFAKCIEALRTNQKVRGSSSLSGKRSVVPWRETKFTQLLQPYFEYGSPAFMIHVNPAAEQARVTSEVFRFAERAGALVTTAKQKQGAEQVVMEKLMTTTAAAEAARWANEVQRLQQALAESQHARVQQEARIRKACAEETRVRFAEMEVCLKARATSESSGHDGQSELSDERLDAASVVYKGQISALEALVAQLQTENAALVCEVARLRGELTTSPVGSASLPMDQAGADDMTAQLSIHPEATPDLTSSPLMVITPDGVVTQSDPSDVPHEDEHVLDEPHLHSSICSFVAEQEWPIIAPAAECLALTAAAADACTTSEARGQLLRPASRFPKPKSMAARARSNKKLNNNKARSMLETTAAASDVAREGDEALLTAEVMVVARNDEDEDDRPALHPHTPCEMADSNEVSISAAIAAAERSSSRAGTGKESTAGLPTQTLTIITLDEVSARAVRKRMSSSGVGRENATAAAAAVTKDNDRNDNSAGSDGVGDVVTTKSVQNRRRLRKRRKTGPLPDAASQEEAGGEEEGAVVVGPDTAAAVEEVFAHVRVTEDGGAGSPPPRLGGDDGNEKNADSKEDVLSRRVMSSSLAAVLANDDGAAVESNVEQLQLQQPHPQTTPKKRKNLKRCNSARTTTAEAMSVRAITPILDKCALMETEIKVNHTDNVVRSPPPPPPTEVGGARTSLSGFIHAAVTPVLARTTETKKKQSRKSLSSSPSLPLVLPSAMHALLAVQREECAAGLNKEITASTLPAGSSCFLPGAADVGSDEVRDVDVEQQQQHRQQPPPAAEETVVVAVPVKKRKLRTQKTRAVDVDDDDERRLRNNNHHKPRYSGIVEKLTRRG
ncbi:hypothetical protein HDU86_007592 [Geranomyces michiganensis]|nr:hypothetical protein HDU86_007592 [Geranomyces michiganensis]